MSLPDPSSLPPPNSSTPSPRPAPASGKPSPKPAKPQPKPRHGTRPPPDPEAAVGSGSATGFVGMLAKRQFDADVLSATLADEAARRDRLQMAREIPPAPPPAAPAPSPAPPSVSHWYRLAPPLAQILAALLLVIGIWAFGALIYMAVTTPTTPRDVHYPLIAWRADTIGFTRASRIMAWSMLLCLPLAALLIVLANLLRPPRPAPPPIAPRANAPI